MTFYIDLNNKLVTPDRIAEMALDNPALLQELLNGVAPQTQKSAQRENCSQALMFMAETWPEVLLPHWDYFIQLFKSDNGFSKYVAIYVIASLVKVDRSGRFEKSFEEYFTLLDDESVMVASHAALNAAKIAQVFPTLQEKIIQCLLEVDLTHHDPNHLGLVKAYIIEALDVLYPASTVQAGIIEFVKAQINSPSAKAAKLAKIFLKKWGNSN